MTGFKTRHSEYIVDARNKRITGGYFGDKWVTYKHLQAIQGSSAKILLPDGKVVTTGKIEKYI